MFSSLKECASARGYIINTSSNLKLAQSLDNAIDKSDPEVNKVSLQSDDNHIIILY